MSTPSLRRAASVHDLSARGGLPSGVLHIARHDGQRGSSVRACAALPLEQRERGASEMVTSLFGEVDSARAFGRLEVSEHEVQRLHGAERSKALQYGEFDLAFFFQLLKLAEPRPNERFVDIGSGCGRLVFAAAAVYEWELAAGVEILRDLHVVATQAHARLYTASEECGVPLAPCTLVCEEVATALPPLLEAAPSTCVAFVYATCWPSVGPYLTELSLMLATSLETGSRVISVDKQLVPDDYGAWDFRLMCTLELPNYNTYTSTGYVYELLKQAGAVPRAGVVVASDA